MLVDPKPSFGLHNCSVVANAPDPTGGLYRRLHPFKGNQSMRGERFIPF